MRVCKASIFVFSNTYVYLHEVLHLLDRPHLAVVMCGVSTTLSTSRTHTASIPDERDEREREREKELLVTKSRAWYRIRGGGGGGVGLKDRLYAHACKYSKAPTSRLQIVTSVRTWPSQSSSVAVSACC